MSGRLTGRSEFAATPAASSSTRPAADAALTRACPRIAICRWRSSTVSAPSPAVARALWALAAMTLLAACGGDEEADAPEIRPVCVVSVQEVTGGETASLAGTVQAENEVKLAFRIGGRLIERLVNVGDQVAAGQVVARLDPEDDENALRAARVSTSPPPKANWSRPRTTTSARARCFRTAGLPGCATTRRARASRPSRRGSTPPRCSSTSPTTG